MLIFVYDSFIYAAWVLQTVWEQFNKIKINSDQFLKLDIT